MRPELVHEEAFAALGAVAIDALDPLERDAVLSHAVGCVICSVELAALRDTAAMLAFSSPLAADTATRSRGRIRSKLVARATEALAEAPSRAPTPAAPIPSVVFPPERPAVWRQEERRGWRNRASQLAIAASVLLVASLGVLGWTLHDRENLVDSAREQTTLAQLARNAADSLRAAVVTRDSVIAGITGRDVSMMTLASLGANTPFANMFWDKTHNTWTLVAHRMPALKPGRTYQLWLVTRTAKISAGTFNAPNGDAMMRATYALPASELRALAVTEEQVGGAPQPTGAPVIAVQAH